MVIGILGTGKFLKYALIIMSAITVVSSIFSGFLVGINTGDWEDLARSTGGRLLSTDRDISLSVEKLKDVQINPDKYDVIDVDNIKGRIWSGLGILAIISFLIFKLLMFLWDAVFHDVNIFSVLIAVIGALFIMSSLQIGWIMYESKYVAKEGFTNKLTFPEAVPFYGSWNLITNFGLMGITGSKNLFGDLSTILNQTISDTNQTTEELPSEVTIVNY